MVGESMLRTATIGSALVKEINEVLGASTHFMSPNNLWFRRKLMEAEKLKASNETEAYNVLAQLYALAGDATEAERHIDTAIWMSNRDARIVLNKATVLSNLGLFSRAIDAFKEGISPYRGEFTSRWSMGMLLGCFHALERFVEEAKPMKLEHMDSVDTTLIEKVVRLMDNISMSDEDLLRFLDVAGEILREQKLIFVGEGPSVSVWDQDQIDRHVFVGFKIPVSVQEAIILDEELGHRLFEKCGALPPEVMIHFESGFPSNERIAERPSITR